MNGDPVHASLAALAAAIQSIEQHAAPSSQEPQVLDTGWAEINHVLGGGIRHGAIHEWFGDADDSSSFPQAILTHLAWRAARPTEAKRVVWIGRRCWPYPSSLVRGDDRMLLDRSVLVDPPDGSSRFWAIDQALRSPAVSAVIADGGGLSMSQSRRLQLAAESGRVLALLVRPASEMDQLSAAFTRWRVRSTPASTSSPRWIADLMRCKGMRPCETQPCWVLEWDRAKGVVHLPADLGDGSSDSRQADELVRRSA